MKRERNRERKRNREREKVLKKMNLLFSLERLKLIFPPNFLCIPQH